MKFPTDHGNVGVRYVDRPDVLSKYFNDSNCVDCHNQVRQFKLALEKKWVTHDPYFRLFMTLLGINVADCWKLSHYHNLFHINNSNSTFSMDREDAMSIKKFAGILAKQLLKFADQLQSNPFSPVVPPSIHTQATQDTSSSSMGMSTSSTAPTSRSLLSAQTDVNGIMHLPFPFKASETQKGILPQ
jgi:hypothetical protein